MNVFRAGALLMLAALIALGPVGRPWPQQSPTIRVSVGFWPGPGNPRPDGILRAAGRAPVSTTAHPNTPCDILRRSTSVPSTGSAPAGTGGPRPPATKGPSASSTGTRARGIRTRGTHAGTGDPLRPEDCRPLRLPR